MPRYQEYCPISAATDIIGDRWTLLVLREVAIGSTSFNDIHRGVPRMSRSLLAQRLRDLVKRGMLDRVDHGPGRAVDYSLTPAGEDLVPMIWELGMWASRWVFRDPVTEDLDASWLVWRLHQLVDLEHIPPGRTTVEFRLTGAGGGRAWLVMQSHGSTACWVDPGYEVDLVVDGDNREMHRWLLGRTPLHDAVAAGLVSFQGPTKLARSFESWFEPAKFAPLVAEIARQEAAAEKERAAAREAVLASS